MQRVSKITFTSGGPGFEGQNAFQVHDLETDGFTIHDDIDGERISDLPNCEWTNVKVLGEAETDDEVQELIWNEIPETA